MAERRTDDPYLAYLEEIQKKVCLVCLDRRDDGTCRLDQGRTCAVQAQLPRLVEAVRGVRSGRMDEYVSAVEAEVCSRCDARAESGACSFRDRGECGLWMYLALVVDAVESVDGAPVSRPPARDQ
jgi:hypothetical protein